MLEPPLLQVEGLSKRFGRVIALNKVTFSIAAGEIVGLVGPNGAGKTTLLMLLAGYLRPSAGRIANRGVATRYGIMPESTVYVPDIPVFYGFLTPREYLSMIARAWGKRFQACSVEEALSRVNLAADGNRKILGFSRGMTQRLAWAHVIITHPKLVLLDEPTSALDPTGIIALRSVVTELKVSGSSMIFSSHSLSEVERLCDRTLFLNEGACSEMLQPGPVERPRFVIQLHPSNKGPVSNLASFATDVQQDGAYITFTARTNLSLHDVSSLLVAADVQIVALSEQSRSLESAFEQKMQQ
jgi:ABC-2 type transport system ATP-binding protein